MSDYSSLKIKGDIVTPDSPNYKAAIARWASNSERNAKIVAFVKDAEDVAATLAFVRSTSPRLPLAIRGGGHSSSGASSAENGLVIDLSKYCRSVRVDPENKLAYVGGGATWADVDRETFKYGLAGVAGTVSHTGVGGLTLGGGFGWLAGQHGLVVDNLAQVTLITADSQILTVNADSHPDLWWGIRGGGCNFGVVTEFVYRVHPQRPTVYGGTVIFAANKLDTLVPATTAWWEKGPHEKEGMMQLVTVGPDRKPCVVNFLFFNGSEEEGRANFKWLFDIGPLVDHSREMPYPEINQLQDANTAPGVPTYLRGVQSTKFRLSVTKAVAAKVAELTKDRPDVEMGLAFEHFPLTKRNLLPNDATACQRPKYSNVLFLMRWKENTPEATKWAQECATALTLPVTDGNEELEGDAKTNGYGNYEPQIDAGLAGHHVADKAQALFGTNYPRLQELKKKYDPELLFAKWFVIQPAA